MRLKIKEAIIVEGKYDKIKLSSLVDAVIVETSGFHIFKDQEQMQLIRQLADHQGIVIFTDSDGAGFVIRNYLTGSIPKEKIKQAYIPDLYGKEQRKVSHSKEGKLGVEGVPKQVILDALRKSGATIYTEEPASGEAETPVTKAELFTLGFTGGEHSSQKRKWLLHTLHLPEHMTTNAMLQFINQTMTHESFFDLAATYEEKK